jgi:site-specific DNA recombinase
LRIRIVAGKTDRDGTGEEIRIARSDSKDTATVLQEHGGPQGAPNESLIQAIVRAHAWVHCLQSGTYASVEVLAEANRLHPKVVRQALRLAFLAPEVTSAILEGTQPAGISLSQIPKLLPLLWTEHRHLLG